MPHVYCLREPGLIALHAVSDAVIALAYFLIPASLLMLLRRRRDLVFPGVFALFGLFILSCGLTHVLGVVTLWEPVYRLDGLVKAITALASMGTAVALFRLMPQMLLIPSPERLHEEIRERERSEREVRRMNELLEQRVAERTNELEKTNHQLAESELRMRSILDGSSLLIFVKDLEGRFTFVNQSLTERLGLNREALIGRTVEELYPAYLAEKYSENDRAVIDEGPMQFEEVVEDSRGTAIYLTSKFPLVNREGKPYAVCGLSTDITERKRAEEELVRTNRELQQSEERFRKIADLVPDMLWSAELDGRMRFTSQRFHEYTGLSEMEFNEKGWPKILHSDDIKEMTRHLEEAAHSRETWEQEVRLRRWDGTYKWFMSRTGPVCDAAGHIEYWLGSFNDIDASKRTERALRRSNEELEQIAYAAAHDLQEPMRNVSVSLGMLGLKFGSQLGSDGMDWIGESSKNAKRIQAMVKDLLQYSRVISEAENAEFIQNPQLAVDRALETLDDEIRASGAQVEVGDLPPVPMREPHFITLLENLVGNALKYRKADVPLVIRISGARNDEGWSFAVSDNGIGFDPVYAERIFKVFKRLHKRDEYGGNGIGLAICARIVAHYGGRIWAEAEPGQGATFRFTI